MISAAQEAEILRLYFVERWSVGTIATQLHIHHDAVQRVVNNDQSPKHRKRRSRMIDPYLPFIMETLEKYPKVAASRLFDMAMMRGYPGKESQFRAVISEIRPRRGSEAYLRLKVIFADQAQVDWGHFGRIQVGKAQRHLSGFAMVLSYSRALFLTFFKSHPVQPLNCSI